MSAPLFMALASSVQIPAVGALTETAGNLAAEAADTAGQMTTAVEIAVLLTVLSVLPALVITMTSFTRIVIVFSFVRRAMAINELPPNPILIGLALFLTTFVMAPVADGVYQQAWVPYRAGELAMTEAAEVAWDHMGGFLLANTRESELAFFAELAEVEPPIDPLDASSGDVESPASSLPVTVLIPAFILSELKTAFQMGFLLFLPFLVIDMVVASVLLSMGMFMLPPVMISTPFKILVFVLVDGWTLISQSVVESFVLP